MVLAFLKKHMTRIAPVRMWAHSGHQQQGEKKVFYHREETALNHTEGYLLQGYRVTPNEELKIPALTGS